MSPAPASVLLFALLLGAPPPTEDSAPLSCPASPSPVSDAADGDTPGPCPSPSPSPRDPSTAAPGRAAPGRVAAGHTFGGDTAPSGAEPSPPTPSPSPPGRAGPGPDERAAGAASGGTAGSGSRTVAAPSPVDEPVVYYTAEAVHPAATVARAVGHTSTGVLVLLCVAVLALRLTVGWPRFPSPYLGQRRRGSGEGEP